MGGRDYPAADQGQKSLDDFCKLFHGAPGGTPALKTYTFDDVVNALNQVAAYDWRGFWTERLTNHGPGAPLGGIEGSGWKVDYKDTPTDLFRASERDANVVAEEYTVGLRLREDGTVIDTIEGMLAAKGGIGPGMKIMAVNGRRFSVALTSPPLISALGVFLVRLKGGKFVFWVMDSIPTRPSPLDGPRGFARRRAR